MVHYRKSLSKEQQILENCMVLTGIIVSTFVVVIAGVDVVAVAFAVDIVTLVKVGLTTTVIVGGIDTEILSLLLLVVFF